MTTTILTQLDMAKRPKLLMRAAKFACFYYRRETDLARVLGSVIPTSQEWIVQHLIALEREHEVKRCQHDAAYFAADHIDCLAALISETVLLLNQDKTAA